MPKIVSAKEVYAQPEPSDDLTWAICEHTFHAKRECCGRCPRTFEDPDYGTMIRGCRAQAEEIARAAMAVLRKESWRSPSDTVEEVERLKELARTAMRILAAEDKGAVLVQCVEEIEDLKKTLFEQGKMLRQCITSEKSGEEPTPAISDGQRIHGAPATDCQSPAKK